MFGNAESCRLGVRSQTPPISFLTPTQHFHIVDFLTIYILTNFSYLDIFPKNCFIISIKKEIIAENITLTQLCNFFNVYIYTHTSPRGRTPQGEKYKYSCPDLGNCPHLNLYPLKLRTKIDDRYRDELIREFSEWFFIFRADGEREVFANEW